MSHSLAHNYEAYIVVSNTLMYSGSRQETGTIGYGAVPRTVHRPVPETPFHSARVLVLDTSHNHTTVLEEVRQLQLQKRTQFGNCTKVICGTRPETHWTTNRLDSKERLVSSNRLPEMKSSLQ